MLGQVPATGIPQVDALLAKLPEEIAKFQRLPARLTAVNNAALRVPGALQGEAQDIRNRVAQAQATYGRLSGLVADLLTAYQRHTVSTTDIPRALSLATGAAALQQTTAQLERDVATLAGGTAVGPGIGAGTLVYVGGGAVVGYFLGGGIGALVGGALGLLAGARR